MRVAQVMAGAAIGGAELFFERLTIALHKAGVTILPVIRRNQARAARLSAAGLSSVELAFGGPFDLLTRPRLKATLRRFRPDVVVTWMNRAARHTPPGDWVLAGRLGGHYAPANFRDCAHLIANTHHLAAWIASQGVSPERIHYLPNFVGDLAGAPPTPRASLGVPENATLLLALGRLHPNKGFDTLIRALALVPGAHAAIAGEGPQRESLENLARTMGVADRVHLPGWRDDIAPLLAACDIFTCPSRHEPLGNMVLEAWSARRPVIAAAAAGPRELLTDGTGILVPLENSAALAAAIRALEENPARAAALAEAGRARFASTFAKTPVLAQWQDFFARVKKP
jgi:glycosyltransferase involved in cell wall biosynthesis